MKKVFILIALFAFVGTGCKYFKKKPKTDPVAEQKAKEDSIRKAKELEAEQIRLAQEKALQDSIANAQAMASQFRFHVIIGSFKVPSNAASWEQDVRGMGYSNVQIVHAPNGFDLVSVGAYETYSKAFNEIDRINSDKEEPVELWIYENR